MRNKIPNRCRRHATPLRPAISMAILFTLSAPGVRSQSQAPPAFEVASVKPAGVVCRGKSSSDPREVRYSNFSLKGLVRDAYQVELFQIDAPQWLDSQCYDVVATLPDGASQAQVSAMLQALLAERFLLKVHTETRQARVYALIVAKSGPRLRAAKQPGDRARSVAIQGSRIEFTSATLDSFGSAMSVLLASPVLNQTGIQGFFDITLNVTLQDLAGFRLPSNGPSPEAPPESNASSSIFTAMQELGLKLESRNLPIQHILVDNVEKMPTGN